MARRLKKKTEPKVPKRKGARQLNETKYTSESVQQGGYLVLKNVTIKQKQFYIEKAKELAVEFDGLGKALENDPSQETIDRGEDATIKAREFYDRWGIKLFDRWNWTSSDGTPKPHISECIDARIDVLELYDHIDYNLQGFDADDDLIFDLNTSELVDIKLDYPDEFMELVEGFREIEDATELTEVVDDIIARQPLVLSDLEQDFVDDSIINHFKGPDEKN